MDESLIENDFRIEHEIAKYLDSHLYLPPLFSLSIRTPDEKHQRIGCDIILDSDELGLHSSMVDEKAAFHHVNEDLPSFAFELMSHDSTPGWFLNTRNRTDYYLLIWPFVKQSEVRGRFDEMTCEDISGARYLVVKRDKIIAYLNNRGFTKRVLFDKAQEIVRNDLRGRIDAGTITENNHFHFYRSYDYHEKPVNLVINRFTLWCLADKKNGGIIGAPAKSMIRRW